MVCAYLKFHSPKVSFAKSCFKVSFAFHDISLGVDRNRLVKNHLLYYILQMYFLSDISVDTVIKIHSGLTSLSPLAIHLRVDEFGALRTLVGNPVTLPIHLNSNNFYISINGPMSQDDYVYLAFSDLLSSSKSSEYRICPISKSQVK